MAAAKSSDAPRRRIFLCQCVRLLLQRVRGKTRAADWQQLVVVLLLGKQLVRRSLAPAATANQMRLRAQRAGTQHADSSESVQNLRARDRATRVSQAESVPASKRALANPLCAAHGSTLGGSGVEGRCIPAVAAAQGQGRQTTCAARVSCRGDYKARQGVRDARRRRRGADTTKRTTTIGRYSSARPETTRTSKEPSGSRPRNQMNLGPLVNHRPSTPRRAPGRSRTPRTVRGACLFEGDGL